MPQDDRLTLFGSFTSSSSYKPMLYLALAGLPFSFRTVNLKYGAQKQPDYLAVNRYGQVPALRHRGLTIVQSNVILDYLARTTGSFAGATEQDQWTAREWLSWEADNITNVAKVRHYSRFRAVDPAVMDYYRPLAEAAIGFVDAALAGRDWLVGDAPTIADIGCWGRMVFMAEGGLGIERWPNVAAWSRRLGALPGFALPYDLIQKDREIAAGVRVGVAPEVVGIVAGRIGERFSRPACVAALADGVAKGSGRSVPGLDLGAAVIAARQAGILATGGGHPMAAGFSLQAARLADFHAFLDDRLARRRAPSVEWPTWRVEEHGRGRGIQLDRSGDADPARLAPFGPGNAEPMLILSRARVVRADRVGREANTVRAFVEGEGGSGRLKAISSLICERPRTSPQEGAPEAIPDARKEPQE